MNAAAAAMTGVKPQDRLAWHRQLNGDSRLSDLAVRLALTISEHLNNATGKCFLSMERLARVHRVHPETARKEIKALAKCGHLWVDRGGGRGLANVYAMLLHEPDLLPKNTSATAGVSTPKPQRTEPQNPRASAGPTLKKENSKKSASFPMKEVSQPGPPQNTPSTAGPGYRIGANGRAVLKVGSPEWQAWLDHHQASGSRERAGVMTATAERSRWGEWEEPTPWPPTCQSRKVARQ